MVNLIKIVKGKSFLNFAKRFLMVVGIIALTLFIITIAENWIGIFNMSQFFTLVGLPILASISLYWSYRIKMYLYYNFIRYRK